MIAFTDVETTGLDADIEYLLEVAVIVTDDQYREQGRYEAVVFFEPIEVGVLIENTSAYVRQMHEETGLWDRLTGPDAKPYSQIDHELYEFLGSFEQFPMPLGGNSPALDQAFIRRFLPTARVQYDYHMRDVSTIAAFAQESFDVPVFQKRQAHKAMDDIEDCIAELIYYRDEIASAWQR
jgi:oligoribonuclease